METGRGRAQNLHFLGWWVTHRSVDVKMSHSEHCYLLVFVIQS